MRETAVSLIFVKDPSAPRTAIDFAKKYKILLLLFPGMMYNQTGRPDMRRAGQAREGC
jgi:hypothetical protein